MASPRGKLSRRHQCAILDSSSPAAAAAASSKDSVCVNRRDDERLVVFETRIRIRKGF